MQDTEFRAVMSWGHTPNDLDIHNRVYDDDGELQCDVYYGDKECGNVHLDIDNTDVG